MIHIERDPCACTWCFEGRDGITIDHACGVVHDRSAERGTVVVRARRGNRQDLLYASNDEKVVGKRDANREAALQGNGD